MKRKIIADQIRQRVQTKTSSDDPQSPPSGRKRRGRPPKISQEDYEVSTVILPYCQVWQKTYMPGFHLQPQK